MDEKHNRAAWLAAAGVSAGLAGYQVIQRLREADWHGRAALVTGASRGLGFLLARELAQQGCRIVICARDEQELRRAADDLRAEGAEVFAVRCDVADRAQVERMVDVAVRRVGPIDILVNNAGIIEVGPLESMTIQDFETAMAVMFWGALYPTLALLPYMQQRKTGWIVNITSIGGKISAPHLLPYNASKFAAVGLSEGLRAELARDGISVTTVCPGFMRTGSYLNALFKGKQEGEFTWFALGSSLPMLTISAERAAQQIIGAAKRGQAEFYPAWWAPWAIRFHGLFPGTTANLMGVFNRFLPSYGGAGTAAAPGKEVERRVNSSLLDWTTGLGRAGARQHHEFPGPRPDVQMAEEERRP